MNARRHLGRRRGVHTIASTARLPQPLYLAEPLEPRMLLAIGPVGEEFRVTNTPARLGYNTSRAVDIGADADGDFIATWHSYGWNYSGRGIYARRYAATGEPFGATFRVNTTTALDHYGPSVGVAANGNFVIAWTSWTNAGADVYAQRYAATGEPLGAEFRVNTTAERDQQLPTVVVEAGGSFAIFWSSIPSYTANTGFYVQRYNAAGEPLGSELRVRDNPGGTVAMDADGDFVVAWPQHVNSTSRDDIYAQRFTATGVALGGAFRVNTTTQRYVSSVELAMGADGRFGIAWQSAGPEGYEILARRYGSAGEPLGSDFHVTPGAGWRGYPSVAVDSDGEIAIAWTSYEQDGSEGGVYARRYGASGQPLGGQFRLNTTTAGDQRYPVLATNGGGHLITGWQSRESQSAFGDIFVQRYEGFANPASIGDLVWNDLDGDGVQGPNEPGMEGVTVQLFMQAGQMVDSAITSDGGRYLFNSVRPNEAHYLEFDVHLGFVFAAANQGNNDALDSDADPQTGRTAVFTLAADEVNLSRDVGLVALASLAGMKFNDRDRDGVRDDGEEGLAGWVIYLDADGDGRLDQGEMSTTTDSSGRYSFDHLQPGVYRVTEVEQDHWKSTAPKHGSHRITLIPGQDAAGVDFAAITRVRDWSAEPIGPEFRVNSTTADNQALPAVAMDADGDFVVAWATFAPSSTGARIYVQRYDRRGSPRGEEMVVATTTGFPGRPAVATDDDGDFVVVWVDFPAGVMARRYNAAGEAQGEPLLVGAAAYDTSATVAMDADGDFVVAWSEVAEYIHYWHRGLGVYARRYSAAGEPGAPVRVDTTTTNGEVAIAMDDDGDYVVAWSSGEVDCHFSYYSPPYCYPIGDIYARRYDKKGNPEGGEFRVSTANAGNQASPAVAMDADGDFVVAWDGPGYYYGGWAVSAQRYNAEGEAQGSELSVGGEMLFWASVAMDRDGDFVIVGRGSGYDIHAARYNAAGLPQGQFRVNATTDGYQFFPSVAMDRDGDFVVAWQSWAQDGDGWGVYAQRYEAIPGTRWKLRASPEVAGGRAILDPRLGLLSDDATNELIHQAE